jgi:peptidoglycan/xylan/chitin deacetylase (PgdA/CDA1 family)
MNRREFTKTLGAAAIAMGIGKHVSGSENTSPQFAITMDDFAWHNAVHLTAEDRNRAILDALGANRAKAALFVVGSMVDSEERGKNLLRFWGEAGHIIGNHTYSHRSLNSNISAAEYEQDISRAEEVLKEFKQFRKIFRYPLLKEGNTAVKRDHVRAFLKQKGYRIGHVTIDTSDWIVDQRLVARLQKDPHAGQTLPRLFSRAHVGSREVLRLAGKTSTWPPGEAHGPDSLQFAERIISRRSDRDVQGQGLATDRCGRSFHRFGFLRRAENRTGR